MVTTQKGELKLRVAVEGSQDAAQQICQVEQAHVGMTRATGQVATAQAHSVQDAARVTAQTQVEQATRAQAAVQKSLNGVGVSARQTAAAMRQLPAQFTDIITSLQGGQNPLTVLLQQGGQIKDSFGGVGSAARALGGYIAGMVSPLTVGAAALGVLAVAAYKGADEQAQLARALVLTGGQAGQTAGQLQDAARRVSAVVGTQGQAVQTLAGLVSAGAGRGVADLEALARAAIALERNGGPAVETTIKLFGELARDPVEALKKLSDATGQVTPALYAQVQALLRQGDAARAAALAQQEGARIVQAQADALRPSLGYLERAWQAVGDGAQWAWDRMLGLGREQTLSQKIDDLDRLAKAQAKANRGSSVHPGLVAVAEGLNAQALVDTARESQRLANRAAQSVAERAAAARRAVDAEKDWGDVVKGNATPAQRLADEMERIERLGRDSGKSEQEIARQKTQARARMLGGQPDQLVQQQAEFERAQRRLVDADLLASVRDRVARSVITQEQGISEVARIEREASLAHAREMDALANRTKDPVKRDKAVKDAALARQEALNIERQEQRELNALREKDLQTYHAQVSAAVMEDIKRRQSLEDSAHAMGLQTVQARESGVVIESVATILAREEAARYAVAAAMTEQSIAAALSRDASEEELAALRTHLDLLQHLAEQKSGVAKASGSADLRQAGLDQTKRLFGDQDPFANFGQTLRDALGGAADGLARMVGAMGELNASAREYTREMEVIKELRESGDKNNSKTADENELRLIKKKESAQINAYASMASAAKGYFGKQTAAYKILHGAEQALRTYQLVMSAQTMAKDLAAIGAKVSAWLAGDAAITSSAVASAGVQVTASSTEGAAAAAAGVANQAKGDPYSAFARMAAMAAMMAALGFAVSGSGRSSGITYDSFAAQKANDGTGTVFGDSKAQSQSIANSLQTLERIARPELQYTSQMLMHLRSIDQALGGATGLLLSRGLLSSDYQGASTGKKGFLGFSGSSSSSSVSSEGVNFGAQSVVQALMQGVLVDAYRIIRTDWSESSWWGLSKSSGSDYSTSWGKVDGEATARFSKAVAEMRNTALAAADVLGRDTASKLVDALDTGLGKVEWKPDASLDDINRQISAVFGQLGDRMAQAVLPAVTDFALGGEGYLETLTRLSAGLEEARAYALRLGLGIGELAEMSNKAAKDVGAELVREAILKKETGNLAKLIETMSGAADDLAGAYTGLLDVRAALESLGFSAQSVSANLLRGAGGMDGLQAGVRSFEENFLTPIERLSQQKSRTELEFSRLGQQLPASAQAFKEMVLAVDASTAAGQERLGKLLSLSDSYARLRDLQNEVDQAAKDAVKDSGQRIVDWLAKLDSSALGLATATERASTGRVQYGVQLALARAGDKTALESITTSANDYLQAARDAAGNQLEYAIQLAQVKSDLAMLPAARTYIEQMTADQLRTMTESRDGILALKLLLADLKDLQLAQAATLAANTGKSASRTEDLLRMLERLEADGVFGGAA